MNAYNAFGLDFQMNWIFASCDLDGVTVEMRWDGMGYMVKLDGFWLDLMLWGLI